MRNLNIAYGNSCFAKTWTNKTVTFEELGARLEQTVRTTESVEEYPKLPKAERDRIKDKGGFVGGLLRDNRRKRENVVCRSMLTLDADHADTDFIDRFTGACRYAACLYTTHSHTPESPRVRIIVPFARDATPDEFAAIARYFAEEWGIDQFDECSYRPHQLMYWPTTPANGVYVFRRVEGAWLDPDEYLSTRPNWRDCSLLPTSSRESCVRVNTGRQQQDPLEKTGVVGAFCRAYPVTDAIEKYLSELYEPSVIPGRYDYIPADSSAGVVIYDDKFAYSHHATDPACGQLLNAFDLVRIHLFGHLEDKASCKAMNELTLQDEAVSARLLEEHRLRATAEFARDEDWTKKLTRDRQGRLENTLGNLILIFTCDEALSGIRYNRLANQIYAEHLPWARLTPAWRDADTAQLVSYIDANYGEFSARNYELALTKVADDRAYHPVRDYLERLPPWDGTPRTDTLFIDYLGAEDTPYTRAVTRKTLTAAVARIQYPGIKFDSIPVLNGNQGIGKTTLVARLGKEWYSDSLSISDMKDKTAPEKLQGNWILELSELAGIKKMDVEIVKSFASRVDDKYRPSYGRVVESHPRQCIIIGTTNNDAGFLRDVTGNRRFWPIRVSGEGIKRPWDLTEEVVDQLWAESLVHLKAGEELFLKGDAALLAAYEQRNAMESDDREGLVREYLDTLLPENWHTLDLYERRSFLNGTDVLDSGSKGSVRRDVVCNLEIWCECFGKDPSSIKKADSYEIGAIMEKMEEWDKSERKSFDFYGRQRSYRRTKRTAQNIVLSCCPLPKVNQIKG